MKTKAPPVTSRPITMRCVGRQFVMDYAEADPAVEGIDVTFHAPGKPERKVKLERKGG